METQEAENTVKQLCVWAIAERHPRKARKVVIRIRAFLNEHREVLRSMSDDTFESLRRVLWH
jgi:secreted Zn-dependent insulinase-like peptidase